MRPAQILYNTVINRLSMQTGQVTDNDGRFLRNNATSNYVNTTTFPHRDWMDSNAWPPHGAAPISNNLRVNLETKMKVKSAMLIFDSERPRMELTVVNNDLVEGDIYSLNTDGIFRFKVDLLELDDEDTVVVTTYLENISTVPIQRLITLGPVYKLEDMNKDQSEQANWINSFVAGTDPHHNDSFGTVTLTTGRSGMEAMQGAINASANSVSTTLAQNLVDSINSSDMPIQASVVSGSGITAQNLTPPDITAQINDAVSSIYFNSDQFAGTGHVDDPVSMGGVINDLIQQQTEIVNRLNEIERNATNQGSDRRTGLGED